LRIEKALFLNPQPPILNPEWIRTVTQERRMRIGRRRVP
jgi:hypothetical protein